MLRSSQGPHAQRKGTSGRTRWRTRTAKFSRCPSPRHHSWSQPGQANVAVLALASDLTFFDCLCSAATSISLVTSSELRLQTSASAAQPDLVHRCRWIGQERLPRRGSVMVFLFEPFAALDEFAQKSISTFLTAASLAFFDLSSGDSFFERSFCHATDGFVVRRQFLSTILAPLFGDWVYWGCIMPVSPCRSVKCFSHAALTRSPVVSISSIWGAQPCMGLSCPPYSESLTSADLALLGLRLSYLPSPPCHSPEILLGSKATFFLPRLLLLLMDLRASSRPLGLEGPGTGVE